MCHSFSLKLNCHVHLHPQTARTSQKHPWQHAIHMPNSFKDAPVLRAHVRMCAHVCKTARNTKKPKERKTSTTGTRTRVTRVRAENPNQLDHSGGDILEIVNCIMACFVHFGHFWVSQSQSPTPGVQANRCIFEKMPSLSEKMIRG